MDVLKDPKEFGQRVGSARGYMPSPKDKKTKFAKLMGVSVPTLTRWEEGEVGSIGATTAERRQLAERLVKVSGCPPETFGLSEPEPRGADQLRSEFEQKLKALKMELLGEIEKVRRAQASPPSSSKPAEED